MIAEAEWQGICTLIDEGWPGDFDEPARVAWRLMLEDLDLDTMMLALKRLLGEGRRFRPSVSEFLAAARRDPTRPTYDEAYLLIFGRGGALRARDDDAALKRAWESHPLVGSFLERQGVRRLAMLPVDDPDWGEKHRRDLGQAWERHVEAMEGREIAAIAQGHGELARLDPLAALGMPPRAQISPSPDSEASDARPPV